MADATAEHHDCAAETTCQDPECRKKMLVSCPILRMGKVDPNTTFVQAGRAGGVEVIPRAQCIGCGICTKKCKHGLTQVYKW